jgi:ADP-ribosyl-[dinitrogen reductase] hydrolase
MLGAIVGDIVGSVYEFDNHKSKDFPLFREDSKFTDDTILTIATADALMHSDWDFAAKYREYASKTGSL